MLRVVIAIGALLLGVGAAFAQEGPIVLKAEVNIDEKGSFLEKTGKELGTQEAAAMITAACAVFETDCSKEAAQGTQLIKKLVVGDDVNGEDHHAVIHSPDGYDMCKVKVDWKNASIDGESTFNAVILRNPQNNGFGYYAVVPKHRKEGHWLKAMLYLEFVPKGTADKYGCWADKSNPWVCKGPNCNTFVPGSKL
jgi:hypothetical protein